VFISFEISVHDAKYVATADAFHYYLVLHYYVTNHTFLYTSVISNSFFDAAMSNPNGLLSQKISNYLKQGRTLKYILMRAALRMAYLA